MPKYIFLILMIFFIGCENDQKKSRFTKEQITSLNLNSTKILNTASDSVIKVDLNPFLNKQSFDFESLIKDVKLIPLETTNESLLDDIRKVIVTDSNIYIHDDFKDGGIVIFNSKGKFLHRIPNGKGPGELIRLYDISFDNNKNELIAYKHSFLLFYTPSGKFIRQERLPFTFHKFTAIAEGYVFKSIDLLGNEHLGLLKDFTLLITSKDFKLKSVALPCSPTNVNLEGRHYLYNNEYLSITQKFADTIYQYNSNAGQLKAKYILDYTKKKLPEHYTQGNWDLFEKEIKQNDNYFYLGEYLDAESHQTFFLENWHIGMQTIVFRDNKSGNLKGGTDAIFNSNNIPPIAWPKSVSGNYFISYYYPQKNSLVSSNSSIISDMEMLKMKGLTENDNPVLVLFKLKNF